MHISSVLACKDGNDRKKAKVNEQQQSQWNRYSADAQWKVGRDGIWGGSAAGVLPALYRVHGTVCLTWWKEMGATWASERPEPGDSPIVPLLSCHLPGPIIEVEVAPHSCTQLLLHSLGKKNLSCVFPMVICSRDCQTSLGRMPPKTVVTCA